MSEEVKVADLKVDEVLELVGQDEEKAAQALEAEKASEHPRTTLIEGLEAVLAPDEPEETPDEVEASDEGPGEGDPEEPEEAPEEAVPSDFSPSNQDMAQNAMVAGAQALEESKREQLKARLGK